MTDPAHRPDPATGTDPALDTDPAAGTDPAVDTGPPAGPGGVEPRRPANVRGSRRAVGGVATEDDSESVRPGWRRSDSTVVPEALEEREDSESRGDWLRDQRPPHWG